MPTSNNNRTAERLPSRPLAPAERLPPRPLALNDNYLSYPSVHNNYNNNNNTPRGNSPHSHPPHHEGMRDQSLSLHPYSGRDSDSYGLMTPMSANNNNQTTKSSSISSNHSNNHSYISNHYSNNSNHNNNYSDSSITYNNTLTISSPQSHHLHHTPSGIRRGIIYKFLPLH